MLHFIDILNNILNGENINCPKQIKMKYPQII